MVLLTGWHARRPGIYVALFTLLYMPARFGLDFLRIADATYAGLTPAQWAAVLLLCFVPIALQRGRALPMQPPSHR